MQANTPLNKVINLITASRYSDAESMLNGLIRMDSRNYLWFELLGLLYVTLTDGARAEKALEKALSLNPGSHLAWNNYGNALAQSKKYPEALEAYKRAISIAPGYADPNFNMGRVYFLMGEFDQALGYLSLALREQPGNPLYLTELGLLYQHMGEHEVAIRYFEQALKLEASNYVAQHNISNSFVHLGRYEAAASVLHQINKLSVENVGAVGLEMHCHTQVANWPEVRRCMNIIENRLPSGEITVNPFHLLSQTDDENLIRTATRDWLSKTIKTRGKYENKSSRSCSKKRLGIVSPDLRSHPVGMLAERLLKDIDASGFFDFYLISLKEGINDPIYESYSKFKGFLEMARKPVDVMVRDIQSLDLDVLIDMGGLTQGVPLELYGEPLARKTINYLGYPAPLGRRTHDFIMASPYCLDGKILAADDERPLPMNCLPLPRDPKLVPSGKTYTKEDFGIDPGHFVFGSFCHVHKLTEEMFKAWLKILQLRANSVLYLGGISGSSRSILKSTAEKSGINSNRIFFAERIDDHCDHLARLKIIDLFLDTFPYGGHTTVSDAISSAVPVVTRTGAAMHSKIAAAQLMYLGLERCVTTSYESYIDESVRLSGFPAELENIKKIMRSIDYENESKIYFNEFMRTIDAALSEAD